MSCLFKDGLRRSNIDIKFLVKSGIVKIHKYFFYSCSFLSYFTFVFRIFACFTFNNSFIFGFKINIVQSFLLVSKSSTKPVTFLRVLSQMYTEENAFQFQIDLVFFLRGPLWPGIEPQSPYICLIQVVRSVIFAVYCVVLS